jgi:hypothetical protein
MDHKPIGGVSVHQSVLDADGEGYDRHCRQLTAEAKIGLQCGLRCDCERCGVVVKNSEVLQLAAPTANT